MRKVHVNDRTATAFNSNVDYFRPNVWKRVYFILMKFSRSISFSHWHNRLIDHAYDVLSDHYWKGSRKHLNLAFHLNILKGFIPIFYSYADGVVKDMEKNLDGKEFDLLFPLAQLTARSVAG